jgi:aminobenzoyl-glutamate utilization protein B
MSEITYKNLELVGPPKYGKEAKEVGRQIQKNLNLEPMDEPFTKMCQTLTTPQQTEVEIRKGLPLWQLHFTSDDYIEYTWHAPTVRFYTAMAELKPIPGFVYPDWTWNAMSGIQSTVDPMIFTAGKTIGATLVDLLTKPEELEKAKVEFKERTGGGIGGSKWVAPLLPSDFKPPVDLRWPEYVTTVRGEEWWIPTPME